MSACNFATLSNYNSNGQLKVPAPARVRGASGAQVVPSYGLGFGYDALTHGQSSAVTCGGHFTITDAYGKGANNCNTMYVRTLCNSGYQ